MTAFTTLELDENAERVLAAARDGPVILTQNDSPAFVVLTIAEYDRLLAAKSTIVDRLSVSEGEYFDWEPPRMQISYTDTSGRQL